MKYSRIALIFMVLGLFTGILVCSSVVMAEETVTEEYNKDIGEWVEGEGWVNETSEEDSSSSSFSETIESLITSLFSWIPKTLEMFVNILLTPFRAIGQVWENWAGTLSGWAGPIIAAFVVIVILLMVRIYTGFDDALDTFQDWISPGDE